MQIKDKHKSIVNQQEYFQNINIFACDNHARKFHIVSAGLLNYLPAIPFVKHEEIYRGILFHRHLSTIEQDCIQALKTCQIEDFSADSLTMLKSKPAIICTFHLGSYRLLNLLLSQHDIPFSLVVSEQVVQIQGADIIEIQSKLSKSTFSLISADAPGSALKMLIELKKGRSLLIYIDGNTGSGRHTAENDNSCRISFLNQALMVRRGIGFLAHATGVPVLPTICYRKSIHEISLKFFELIFPNQQMDRYSFSKVLVQRVYDLAAPYIEKYPEQWEAWLYLPKVAQLINPFNGAKIPITAVSNGELKFDTFRFGLFKTTKNNYIFDKSNFLSYPIMSGMYDKLLNATTKPFCKNGVDDSTFAELLNNGILITS